MAPQARARIRRGDHVDVGEGDALHRPAAAPPHDERRDQRHRQQREQDEGLLEAHECAILRRTAGRPRERARGSTQSAPVSTMTWRAPARASRASRARSVASTVAAKRVLEARVGRVDQVAAAGLEVAQVHRADVGHARARGGSRTSIGDQLVAAAEGADGALEAGLEREVGDQDRRRRGAGRCARATRRRRTRSVRPPSLSSGTVRSTAASAAIEAAAVARAAGAPGRCRRRAWRGCRGGRRGGACTTPTPASTSRASSSFVWAVRCRTPSTAEQSTSAQAVSTGSISGTRTIGSPMRALRGQSTQRTSSPSS